MLRLRDATYLLLQLTMFIRKAPVNGESGLRAFHHGTISMECNLWPIKHSLQAHTLGIITTMCIASDVESCAALLVYVTVIIRACLVNVPYEFNDCNIVQMYKNLSKALE